MLQWPWVLWQRPPVERDTQHLRTARLESCDQLLVGNPVLQNRNPQVLDRRMCIKGEQNLAPGVGLGHADLRRKAELAQLGDRLGPARDQRRAGKCSGETLGRTMLGKRAQADTRQYDHDLDLV